MSFNQGVYDHEMNETMLSGKHFRRKTMVTAYESDVVVEEEIPVIDPSLIDLVYHWDFGSSTNYLMEQITKNTHFDVTGPRSQFLDIYGNKGLLLDSTIRVENGGSSFTPTNVFDNLNTDNLSFKVKYSCVQSFELASHTFGEDAWVDFIFRILYKYGTVKNSDDYDDPLNPSGFENNFNAKNTALTQKNIFETIDGNSTIDIAMTPFSTRFYNYSDLNHTYLATQGVFPYSMGAKDLVICFGHRTKPDGYKYQFLYINKTYVEQQVGLASDTKMYFNRHLPLFEIIENRRKADVTINDVKIYKRFLEVDEIEEYTPEFPFLYHFVCGRRFTYSNHANIIKTVEINFAIYATFTDNSVMYANGPLDYTNGIWYEYELELLSSTSKFGIEFFRTQANNNDYNTDTNNYFDSSFNGLCLGVDGNQFIKYKCGNTIVTTTTVFPLNTRKYISFYYTPDQVLFYFDKILVGTVDKSTDPSLWNEIVTETDGMARFSIFNLGVSNNKAHFIVRHGTEDRGLLDNSVF